MYLEVQEFQLGIHTSSVFQGREHTSSQGSDFPVNPAWQVAPFFVRQAEGRQRHGSAPAMVGFEPEEKHYCSATARVAFLQNRRYNSK